MHAFLLLVNNKFTNYIKLKAYKQNTIFCDKDKIVKKRELFKFCWHKQELSDIILCCKDRIQNTKYRYIIQKGSDV